MRITKNYQALLDAAVKSHILWAYFGTGCEGLPGEEDYLVVMGLCFFKRDIPKFYGILNYDSINNSWYIFEKET